MIAPQSRLVGPGKASVNSNSSIQYSAANLACSGPNSSVTALMKAPNSRSAMTETVLPAISQLRLGQKNREKPIGRRYRSMFPLTRRHQTPAGAQAGA